MSGYCRKRRHSVSRRWSPTSAWWLNEAEGSPWSGSSCKSVSTPPWSSGGIPPKGRPAPRCPSAPWAGRPSGERSRRPRPSGSTAGAQRLLVVRLREDLCVERRAGEKLGVGAVGDDPPLVQQHDAIGQADGREAVGDDERRPPRIRCAVPRGSAVRSGRRWRSWRRRGSGWADSRAACGRSRSAGAGHPRGCSHARRRRCRSPRQARR